MMKKKDLLQRILNLEGERDQVQQEIGRIDCLLGEMRQTIFALTDKLAAAEANAILAADVADLDEYPPHEWFFGGQPSREPVYGKSPADIVKANRAVMDDVISEFSTPFRKENIYDDLIKGKPSRLTASEINNLTAGDVIEAAKKLGLDITKVYEPTDEDLEEIDSLVDDLIADHGKL
jgi:hypothetical protein